MNDKETDKFIKEYIKIIEEAKAKKERVKKLSSTEKLIYVFSAIPIYFYYEWWARYFNKPQYKLFKFLQITSKNI